MTLASCVTKDLQPQVDRSFEFLFCSLPAAAPRCTEDAAVTMRVRGLSLAAALCLVAPGVAAANEQLSVTFCQKFNPGYSAYFTAKERSDGWLDFSLSVWADGRQAGIKGAAEREAGAWIYRSMDSSSQPDRPCIARIKISRAAGARITAEPLDACDGGQGVGATVGDVHFAPSAYAGPSPEDATDVWEADLGARCKF